MRSRLLPLPDPFRLVPRFLLRSQSILSLNESRAGFRREGFGEKEDEDEHADVEEGGEVEDREDVVGVEGDEPRSEDGTDALRNEESKRSVEELEGEKKETGTDDPEHHETHEEGEDACSGSVGC